MKKPDWNALIAILIIIMGIVFFICYIYALITYGNVPISDCPTWVWWILHHNS